MRKRSRMLNRYLIIFAFRLTVFICVLVFYLSDKSSMLKVMTYPVWLGIRPFHVLWAVFMMIMLTHILPMEKLTSLFIRKAEGSPEKSLLTMALEKSRIENYDPDPGYSEIELLRFVRLQNIRAWQVMLVWLCANSVFGILYLLGVLDEADLLMLTVFFFLCDYICILFFCPFQTYIMKNRCCVNCRIYDWGHFMMFTPMLFIKNFFSWSLFFTSVVVLIHWEITYASHPERFWYGSNKTLRCANCNDKTCRLKKNPKSVSSEES